MKKTAVISGFIMLLLISSACESEKRKSSLEPIGPEWVIEDIYFKVRDGKALRAYYLHPKNPKRKYPAVACLHQLWGNRDDFLKMFPAFAESGIIAIAPNLARQQVGGDMARITDLADTIDYLGKMPSVQASKLGIITASFSVETGLMAIKGRPNVIADVMISGPITSEQSKKWITRNSNLAIYTITSLYDQKPGYPPHHHLLMEECLMRSLNPHSRAYFIDDQLNPYSIYAHGTFLFDEIPGSVKKLQTFFENVFEITTRERGLLKSWLPKYTVFFKSTDGFPVAATFRKPDLMNRKIPAVILYPPEYLSRTRYQELVYEFIARGMAVLLPNVKRTCREARTLHLCEKEINGAVNYLKGIKGIDSDRIGIMLPSFYFLSGEQLVRDRAVGAKMIIFMKMGKKDFGVDPGKILEHRNGYRLFWLKKPDLEKMVYLFGKHL